MNLDKITIAWLLFVAFVGGVLGLARRENANTLTKKEKIKHFVIGVATSMFTAYIVFEFIYGHVDNIRIAVAVSGLAAWMGADALLGLEKIFVNLINRKKD